ncbi:hypothetical protein HID58_074629 [Brassica napus]|uniref:Uncharacterized protein n=1 Tax=Brassica napus TaxID=3708 RepID=A0ABQ7YHL2_BRANA|nr:hypothetical protein HID58_074629 [Brassica napus]
MDYHCSTLFLSVVIRYTVFRSAHPSSSDSLWLSSDISFVVMYLEAVPPIGFILSLASLLSPNHFAMSCINKRGESVEDKIKKLDVELCKYREQIQKTRSGPVQQALKARAMRLLKQKKMYEGQRDMLYNQTFNLDQLLSTPVDVARLYMRARLPWGSPSVNNSKFWSPSSAGTQLLKEGTPFSYNAGNLSSSKFSNRKFAYQHVFLMALSELWLSQILACVFIHYCIWPSRTLSRNKLNGTIPVSLTGLPNLINLLLDSNNLNGQIPQTLFQIPKYKYFHRKQLELWCWSTSPLCTEVVRSGDSSKPKTGIIAGVVAGVTVLLFGILVFLFCRDRHKGYKRDVFVDVADSGAAQNINIRTRMNLKSFTKFNLYLLSRFAY